MTRDYLITGHPRSGTGYMAKLFQANGIDLQHEKIGTAGTSNWQFAVKADVYPFDIDGKRRQDVIFKNVYHVIRNPLDAINSIAFTESRSQEFRGLFVPLVGNIFERAVLSYYGWNMLIQSQMPNKTFALDKANLEFRFINEVEIYNKREHDSITEHQLYMACSPGVWSYYEAINRFYIKLTQ